MMTMTWIESRGDCSTGMSCVICGLASVIIATSRANAASRGPNCLMGSNRFCMMMVTMSVAHAINCIVSKPFAIGRCPETYQRRASSRVASASMTQTSTLPATFSRLLWFHRLMVEAMASSSERVR